MTGTTSAVGIANVTKTFGDFIALDRVDLTVAQGEFFSLLGSSGSGKSTLLRVIGGFEEATSGSVAVHGRDMGRLPPASRPTNMVFQNLALFPHMNVVENIGFGLRMKKTPAATVRSRVDDILSLVRLGAFANRRVDQLSGGQRQRVAIARALINDPKVLLLDEPLSALDLKLRQQMQVELRRIQRELGATFIFVTHDQGEAITMSDRIAVMSHGRIVQMGAPFEVYGAPESRFVADFLGDSNFLPARVLDRAGGECTVDCMGLRGPARCPRPVAVGEAVTLAIRLESMVLDAEGGLPAVVSDVVFMGNMLRVTADLAQAQTVRVDLMVEAGRPPLAPGQAVCIGWKPGTAVAMSNEGDPT